MIIKNTDKEYCPTCKKDVDYIMRKKCLIPTVLISVVKK